jgi:hypothetical protein
MATLQQMIHRLETLDVQKIAYEVLSRHKNELVFIQKEQFAAGLNLSGKLMSPTIMDDPFFKGNKRWARWWVENKDQRQSTIFAAQRPKEVPNLIFSTGTVVWMPTQVFQYGENDLRIGTEFGIQMELEDKYGDLFGLTPQGAAYVLRTFFRDEFFREVRKHLFG